MANDHTCLNCGFEGCGCFQSNRSSIIRSPSPKKKEVIYPRDLIRRTYRAIQDLHEPEDFDTAIEMIDVKQAISRLPEQYKHALSAWYIADRDRDEEEDIDWLSVGAELHCSPLVAQVTVKAAWNHLYGVLNGG